MVDGWFYMALGAALFYLALVKQELIVDRSAFGRAVNWFVAAAFVAVIFSPIHAFAGIEGMRSLIVFERGLQWLTAGWSIINLFGALLSVDGNPMKSFIDRK